MVWQGGFLLEERKCLVSICSKMSMMRSTGGSGQCGLWGGWGDKPSPTGSWYSGPGERKMRALLCDSILGAAMAPVVVFGYALSCGVGYRGGEGSAL